VLGGGNVEGREVLWFEASGGVFIGVGLDATVC
jgi:hypothetical protein